MLDQPAVEAIEHKLVEAEIADHDKPVIGRGDGAMRVRTLLTRGVVPDAGMRRLSDWRADRTVREHGPGSSFQGAPAVSLPRPSFPVT